MYYTVNTRSRLKPCYNPNIAAITLLVNFVLHPRQQLNFRLYAIRYDPIPTYWQIDGRVGKSQASGSNKHKENIQTNEQQDRSNRYTKKHTKQQNQPNFKKVAGQWLRPAAFFEEPEARPGGPAATTRSFDRDIISGIPQSSN